MSKMTYTLCLLALTIAVCSAFRPLPFLPQRAFKFVSNAATDCQDFKTEVIESTVPVFVDFYANWCGPCKIVASLFKDLASEYIVDGVPTVKFIKVDTEVHEDTVDSYNIQGLPLLGLFVNGKMIAFHSGALPKDKMREFVTKNLPQ